MYDLIDSRIVAEMIGGGEHQLLGDYLADISFNFPPDLQLPELLQIIGVSKDEKLLESMVSHVNTFEQEILMRVLAGQLAENFPTTTGLKVFLRSSLPLNPLVQIDRPEKGESIITPLSMIRDPERGEVSEDLVKDLMKAWAKLQQSIRSGEYDEMDQEFIIESFPDIWAALVGSPSLKDIGHSEIFIREFFQNISLSNGDIFGRVTEHGLRPLLRAVGGRCEWSDILEIGDSLHEIDFVLGRRGLPDFYGLAVQPVALNFTLGGSVAELLSQLTNLHNVLLGGGDPRRSPSGLEYW